jgi:hypothetical protein
MATSYEPKKLDDYRWIFVSLKAGETDKRNNLISRNFICLNRNKKTYFGAKGNSDVKGNNITVDYDTIIREDIRGELNSAHIDELQNIFGQLGLRGGKRKSKSRKSRKSKKTRKSKSRKTKSRKK